MRGTIASVRCVCLLLELLTIVVYMHLLFLTKCARLLIHFDLVVTSK